MSDDITRGLGLLADEAEAAQVDTDAVIATATARTRNRAILTTAFVTLGALSALVVTLGAVKRDPPPIADTPTQSAHGPTFNLEVPEPATEAEMAERRTRLHDQAVAAFRRILPAGWRTSTFDFDCDPTHCWAQGDIVNDGGTVSVSIAVDEVMDGMGCYQPSCTKELLDDGTLVALTKDENEKNEQNIGGEPQRYRGVSAARPDGTDMSLSAQFPKSRTAPTLTDDQWREFATAFTY